MKYKVLFLLILIASGILFFTNPKEAEHQEFIKNKFTTLFDQKIDDELNKIEDKNLRSLGKLGKNLFPSVSNELIDSLIGTRLRVENYYLFSTTQILYKDEWHTIGYGVFNKVYLLPNVDKKLKDINIKDEASKLLK